MKKFPWLCGHRTRGLWWFRVFGYGVRWKRISQHPLLFSERELNKGWRLGNWHFRWLRAPVLIDCAPNAMYWHEEAPMTEKEWEQLRQAFAEHKGREGGNVAAGE